MGYVLLCCIMFLWKVVINVHLICILLLKKNKLVHKITLMNFNIVQILFLLVQFTIWLLDLLSVQSYLRNYMQLFKLNVVLIPWNNFIFLVIGERLVQTLCKRHDSIDQTERNHNTKLLIFISWIVGLLSFIICTGASLNANANAILQGQTIILLSYQGIICLTFLFAYTLTYRFYVDAGDDKKQICQPNTFKTSCPSTTYFLNSTERQLFWICLVYICFVIVPSSSKYIIEDNQIHDNISTASLVLDMLYILNCLIVDLICIFMNSDMRKGFTDSSKESQDDTIVRRVKQKFNKWLPTQIKNKLERRNQVRDNRENITI